MEALIAKPRGFCAGVDRAIRVVEVALEQYGKPIYVRNEIVHNKHVVARLRNAGAVFVRELEEVPDDSIVIFSAHGTPPWVYEEAERRQLKVIDATCPLVTKVHKEVHRYVKRGCKILFIGHAGHEEVIGTMGQAPDQTTLIESVEDACNLQLDDGQAAVILTQTTLSQDDTAEIVETLRSRYPHLEMPSSDDICYATQNRQNAVKAITDDIDLLLVVGSQNSSNSRRLTEVARSRGVDSHLIDGPEDIDEAWIQDRKRVGISSGASAPEDLVRSVLQYLQDRGVATTSEMDAEDENVTFRMPPMTQLTKSGITVV